MSKKAKQGAPTPVGKSYSGCLIVEWDAILTWVGTLPQGAPL